MNAIVKRLPLAGDLTRTSGDERYASAQKKYQKQTATEEHGSETRESHRIAAADATARLSVAIFVDGARAIDLDAIRTLAAAAAGIDERRGDTLRVEAVRFAASAPAAARGIDAWAIAGLFAGLVPQLALVAGAVVLAVRGARPAYAVLVRAVEAAGVRDAARESAGLPPARVRGALAGEPPHVAAAVISALPAATAAAVLELYPPEERVADRAPAGARGERSGAACGGALACPRLRARSSRWRSSCARPRTTSRRRSKWFARRRRRRRRSRTLRNRRATCACPARGWPMRSMARVRMCCANSPLPCSVANACSHRPTSLLSPRPSWPPIPIRVRDAELAPGGAILLEDVPRARAACWARPCSGARSAPAAPFSTAVLRRRGARARVRPPSRRRASAWRRPSRSRRASAPSTGRWRSDAAPGSGSSVRPGPASRPFSSSLPPAAARMRSCWR